MTEQEKQEYRIEEFNLEQYNEERQREIEDFKDNNKTDLINEFIENNKKDFELFLKNEIIDETYNINYWKEIFCEEEFEDDFNDYVNDSFIDFKENENTERSLINDLYKGVF